MVKLDAPLVHKHLGIFYYHDPQRTPTDLRAAVALMNKNILIQGDEYVHPPILRRACKRVLEQCDYDS